MPNTSAAKKALRQNKARQVRNLRKKRVLSGVIKEYKKAVEAGKTNEAVAKLPVVYKNLDKAAKTNLIKANKANRLKSRLTKRLAVTPAPTEPKVQTEDPEL